MGNGLVYFPIHLAVRAYELVTGVCMYVVTQGQAVSTVICNESKELTPETVMLLVLRLKDIVTAIVTAYVREQVKLHLTVIAYHYRYIS